KLNTAAIYEAKIKNLKKMRFCNKCLGKVFDHKDRKNFICSKISCRHRNKIFVSKTIQESHLKIKETLLLIYKILNGCKIKDICEELGVVKSTVCRCKKNLKAELRKMFWRNVEKLGGEAQIVEADESKF
ncbi:hypothetical protein COBT_003987, partial [Conglomerata obtusa]